jgi:uncharacterized protein (TIGR00730 family)
VVFFGSARVDSRERAERVLAALRTRGAGSSEAAYRAEVDKALKELDWARYYEEARTLARLLTAWSLSLQSEHHRFVVCSGGGPGIMEAANRGASEAAGLSIGLNIGLPHEQRPNPYITRELNFEFRYFFMRKLWFAYLARALVAFPGGFGTLDELMEVLTLQQTGKLDRRTRILLYGTSYWKEIVNFDALVRHGMISAEDLDLFTFADDPGTALGLLQGWLAPAPVSDAAAPDLPSSRQPDQE